MKLQQVLSKVRNAIDDYQMIEEGDRIAIGISGGKDSLTLLYALSNLKRFYPKSFELYAITADMGFNNVNFDRIKALCTTLDVEYKIIKTDIAQIVFDVRKENNPCSLCAKMRKGAINTALRELGCNKVAYAHHRDDVIETMMMSLIYEGRLHTFSPVTHLDKTGITVIRPLLYMGEADVIGFVNKYDVPVLKSSCPVDGHTKREYIKTLLRQINLENPGVKDRMFTAIRNSNMEGWTSQSWQP